MVKKSIKVSSSCHTTSGKGTVCHSVVNFVQTVEHGYDTRRGVARSVNMLGACKCPARPGESFKHTQNF